MHISKSLSLRCLRLRSFSHENGRVMNYRRINKKDTCVVVKVGSSTLSFSNGKINLQRIEQLAGVLTGIKKQGYKVILVSSGAIAVGGGLLGLKKKPRTLAEKQALAAVGQAELMKIYQKFFEAAGETVAQVLLTKDGLQEELKRSNAYNTLHKLLEMGIIPVINENDTVSTFGIRFGNNDVLAAYVAELMHADLLMILSDINGLYTADPRKDPSAKIIETVRDLSPEIISTAGGSKNSFGTGGMTVKLNAARISMKAGIDMIITNGKDPEVIRETLAGKRTGTLFTVHG